LHAGGAKWWLQAAGVAIKVYVRFRKGCRIELMRWLTSGISLDGGDVGLRYRFGWDVGEGSGAIPK